MTWIQKTAMKNLLLISLDCARSDVAYSGILPNLERLRQHGVTFTHAISSAPLTPVSHATVFTGLQPYHHGLRHLLQAPRRSSQRFLATHLQKFGFQTAAIVSCIALNSWYGMARGFEMYDDGMGAYRGIAMKRAIVSAQRAIIWIKNRSIKQPWFCFLHFFDAHWPYLAEEELSDASNGYEAGLKYADKHLGFVLDFLEVNQILNDTLIVVFGDHGEDLEGIYPNDRGGAQLGHPEEKGHGCLLFETTQRVPLVFSHASLSAKECNTLVGLVDVAPTVCSLLGQPKIKYTDGIDLSPFLFGQLESIPRPLPLYAETLYPSEVASKRPEFGELNNLQALWLDSETKLIRNWENESSTKVYFLREDPYEQKPTSLSSLPDFVQIPWPITAFE